MSFERTPGGVARSAASLAGVAVIEAEGVEHAAQLVADTPCARAKGAIEIRPIMQINDAQWTAIASRGSRLSPL